MVEIRPDALANYPDVLTPEVVTALRELAPLDDDRHAVMAARLERTPSSLSLSQWFPCAGFRKRARRKASPG